MKQIIINISLVISHSFLLLHSYRGVEQLVARRAHNPKVTGSSPVPATFEQLNEALRNPLTLNINELRGFSISGDCVELLVFTINPTIIICVKVHH